jgi:hypothetical protein
MDYLNVILRYLVFVSPQVIVLIVCLRYLRTVKSTYAKLMVYGSAISFICYTCSSFLWLLIPTEQFEPMTVGIIAGSINIIRLVGGLLFAFGFFKFVKLYLKQQKELPNELDQIGKK